MTNDTHNSSDSEVDANLRRVFERTLSEDLPDRFKDLLDQLRASEQSDDDRSRDAEK
ncbi:MAG: NepR family anti-sigma factor [Pseudomonadota bacterium]